MNRPLMSRGDVGDGPVSFDLLRWNHPPTDEVHGASPLWGAGVPIVLGEVKNRRGVFRSASAWIWKTRYRLGRLI